jgi:hypothetical protein
MISLNTVLSNINLLAVLVAGFAHMATGLIWFMPGFFGKQWVELTKQELKPARQWIAAGIVGHLLIALVLAVVVYLANATTAVEGLAVGILIWIGFVVTLETGELIWEKIPFRLFTIRVGNHLVALSIAGVILAIWR